MESFKIEEFPIQSYAEYCYFGFAGRFDPIGFGGAWVVNSHDMGFTQQYRLYVTGNNKGVLDIRGEIKIGKIYDFDEKHNTLNPIERIEFNNLTLIPNPLNNSIEITKNLKLKLTLFNEGEPQTHEYILNTQEIQYDSFLIDSPFGGYELWKLLGEVLVAIGDIFANEDLTF